MMLLTYIILGVSPLFHSFSQIVSAHYFYNAEIITSSFV